MNETHKHKLDRYTKLVRYQKQANQRNRIEQLQRRQNDQITETLEGISQTVSEALESVKTIASPEVTVQSHITVEGLEKLPEAIERLGNIKVEPTVNVKAPIVNVKPVIVNEDIYARYKRANSSVDQSGTYHGFLDNDGNWFIQLESGTDKQAKSRYAVGKGSFLNNWAGRVSLQYKLIDEVAIP